MTQENPRQIRELLKLMLDNTRHFRKGLGLWTDRLFVSDVITKEEYACLHAYIRENAPDSFDTKTDGYYWRMGQIEPRIEWIKQHIDRQ